MEERCTFPGHVLNHKTRQPPINITRQNRPHPLPRLSFFLTNHSGRKAWPGPKTASKRKINLQRRKKESHVPCSSRANPPMKILQAGRMYLDFVDLRVHHAECDDRHVMAEIPTRG